jgi:predicted ribosome quality control (RQC) complex YloA/Tae2 family protein
LIFLVPSVWSAVTLVKQNNFEKKAMAFVESHRSIENSVIYDYKIDHLEGSVLKVFMTGETLSSTGRHNLYACAHEYGITEKQLIIKEYITKNNQENEGFFKGIYERLDSEIEQYEQTIEQLNQELQAVKQEELPYQQIAKELAVSYPNVKHIYMGQGAHVTLDSLKVTPCVMVKVQADSTMTDASKEQLQKWMQVRLQINDLQITYTTTE